MQCKSLKEIIPKSLICKGRSSAIHRIDEDYGKSRKRKSTLETIAQPDSAMVPFHTITTF